jgi:hypothetical protein
VDGVEPKHGQADGRKGKEKKEEGKRNALFANWAVCAVYGATILL